MVAVVNGSGLGLFTSLGSSGSASLGQSRERVYVNSTTGNLVIQSVDEILSANGNDLAITRTYNSLGLVNGVAVDGDNNDGWRIGVLRSILLEGSTTSPTRIVKTFGDGAQVAYTLVGGVYRSTEGDGAHDTFQLVSGQWIWTDGSARNTEVYNLSGQIAEARDADGNKFSYGYTGSLITTITVVSPNADGLNPGEGGNGSTTTISLEYLNPTTTKQLQRILVARSGDADQTLTSYAYDGQGRLLTVTVDLTPENTGDSNTYVTTYGYEGTSNRISSITQSAGGSSAITAKVSFSYENLNGSYRLKSYTDGENHTTTFTYEDANGSGGSNTTLTANNGELSTTEVQNVPNYYTLNQGAVSTTDTQPTSNTYPVIDSQITTGGTQTDSYNRNDAALSTTDSQTATNSYNVNNAQITPAGTQTDNYARIDSALSTTKTTVGNESRGLNSGALTASPGGSWGVAAVLEAEPSGSTASAPQVAFDSNGNGFAIWTVTTSTTSVLKAARYTRSTNTWASPTTLYSGGTGVAGQASLSVDSAGNALVAWLAGGAISAKRYTSGAWGSTATVVSSGATLKPTVSINGSFAAIMWGEGSAVARSAYVSRWTGSAWTTKTTIDTQSTAVSELQVAVDNQGNVITAWLQIEGASTVPCVWTNRYRASTNSWSGAVTRDELPGAASAPQVAIDGNGNAFLVFGQEGKTFIVRYERASDSWDAANVLEARPGDVLQTSLAMDAAGNAVFAWVQNDPGYNNAYACLYNAATSNWGPSTVTLESLSTGVVAGSLKASMSGGLAAVVWLQNDGTRDNAYAAAYNGITWTAATLLETSTNTPTAPAVFIDSLFNASALWIQSNGTSPSLYMNRFTAGGNGPLYYTVPAGATWQSIANALYGTNSAAAAAALEAAVGYPALNTGARLAGLPDPLTFLGTTTITVPPYYTIPTGASWQSIANAIYGINSVDAGIALQTAMGNPALTAGNDLVNLPATITTSQSYAAHYLVPAGASWQSIANTLYGVNSAAAGTALQAALGDPSIAAGARLVNIPGTLPVTTTATVTVPPYFTIPSGASWQAIAYAVYGIDSMAAGNALQTAMGNPALTAGNRLTNFPASISIVTNLAPHYLVPAGATWQSVAYTLYGVNNAAAGTTLQTALGNPALTAGARLYSIPSSLTVMTNSTITVPAYYVIPSSPGWQAIAFTLYGINSAAAGNALQAALGNPTLTPENRLTNLPATLTVVTQQNVTVAPYYTVPAGATWNSITQAIYNPTAEGLSAASAALRAATGNPTLTTNLHLTVPASLTYTTATPSTAIRVPSSLIITQEPDTDDYSYPRTLPLENTHEVTQDTPFTLQANQFQTHQWNDVTQNYGRYITLPTSEPQQHTPPLRTGELTTPPPDWMTSTAVAGSTGNVTNAQIKFDNFGNGLAVWSAGNDVRWARYSASTKSWSAAQPAIDTRDHVVQGLSLAIDAVTGNAVVAWSQGLMRQATPPNPPAAVYASIFNVTNGTWAAPSQLGLPFQANDLSTAIRNTSGGLVAAVGYAGSESNLNDNSALRMFAARYSGGTWFGGTALGGVGTPNVSTGVFKNVVGVDSTGIIHAVWNEDVGGGWTLSRRFVGGAWQTVQVVGIGGAGVSLYGGFAANGDGVIAGSSTVVRYVKATGTWTTQSVASVGTLPSVDVDDAGNAVIGYMVGSTFQVITFNGSSWVSPFDISTSAQNLSYNVAIRNGRTVAGWTQASGSNNNVYARAYENGAWQAAKPLTDLVTPTTHRRGVVGIDSTGDMHILYHRGVGGSNYEVTASRYLSSANIVPYFQVDGDPNWQEIAARLYGEDKFEAGQALAAAMPGVALSPNLKLTGMPASIQFTASYVIGEYYDVPSGASWQNVANAVYGPLVPSPQGGVALRAAVNPGASAPSGRLMNLPTSITVTAPVWQAAPDPYFVATGMSWQQVASTLYGINSPAAGAKLQSLIGGVNPPSTLYWTPMQAYSTIIVPVTSTQGITPYYRVPQSASWESVALALYDGIDETKPAEVQAAGAALRAVMGQLTPPVNELPLGGELRGMPDTLLFSITNMVNVTPYYVVVNSDTWTLIAHKVYGVRGRWRRGRALQGALPAQHPVEFWHASATCLRNITYTPQRGTTTVYQQTDVADQLGHMTTYKSTVQGRLVATLSPTVNGARTETRYDYDIGATSPASRSIRAA